MDVLKLGMEISNLNLQHYMNNTEFFDQLKSDVYKYRLIVIRNQGEITAEAMIKMSQHFGEISYEAFTTRTSDMKNHPKSPSP